MEETLNELSEQKRRNGPGQLGTSGMRLDRVVQWSLQPESYRRIRDVTLHVPRLKGVSVETAVIERYRRRESSVEEALIGMHPAGVSVCGVEDITEALRGRKVSPATVNELNKKAYVRIED